MRRIFRQHKSNLHKVLQIIGYLLYYRQTIDYTSLVPLNIVVLTSLKPTSHTLHLCHHLINSYVIIPNITIWFQVSNMIFRIDFDAAFLVTPYANKKIVVYYQLTSKIFLSL